MRGWVSIRTRPFGRVMHLQNFTDMLAATVSIRTRPFGRVMPQLLLRPIHSERVSIRTRPFGRVMQAQTEAARQQHEFQSAPGLSAG